jgi:hypothetical protein
MLRTKIKRNTGVAGLADVRVLTRSLHIHFLEDDEVFEVTTEGWDREGGRYNIVLEKTNDKVKFVSPPGRSEPYYVQFIEFGNRPNGVPEMKKKLGGTFPSQHGGTYYRPDTWVAVVKQEVVEQGLYKGLTIPYDFPYIFAQDPASGAAMLEGKPGEIRKVEEYLRIAGFDFANEDIPYQTNVLPWLEGRLQAAAKIYTVTLNEKGFVQSLGSVSPFIDLSALLGTNGNGKSKANGKSNGKATSKKAKKA